MTDLGTLGLTGSGFEVAAPDVEGLNGFVGTTADATAVSTGDPVEQLVPESSFNVDGSVRYRSRRASAEFTVFVNHIYDNIQKQTLILPQGRGGHAARDRANHGPERQRRGLRRRRDDARLVRANFDNARSWGFEHQGRYQLSGGFSRAHGVHVLQRQGHEDGPRAEYRRRHSRTGRLLVVSTRHQGASGGCSRTSTLPASSRTFHARSRRSAAPAAPRTRNNMRGFLSQAAPPIAAGCRRVPTADGIGGRRLTCDERDRSRRFRIACSVLR
jgi:hypothetical protein